MTHKNNNRKIRFIETTRLLKGRDPTAAFRI